MDSHGPSIEQLQAAIAKRGLSQRVKAMVKDMARPEQPPGSFDLIWSEGALYNMGLKNALHLRLIGGVGGGCSMERQSS